VRTGALPLLLLLLLLEDLVDEELELSKVLTGAGLELLLLYCRELFCLVLL
jgi:hypothetical protein